MNLKRPFFKLPVSREVRAAVDEISQNVAIEDWIEHPSAFAGNTYIPITSFNGTINNLKRTPVKPTVFAEKLPAVTQLLSSFDLTIGISRLMRLAPGHEVPVHSDTNEYWDERVRLHIPLISSDKVFFTCDQEEVVMVPGEVWTFDNWRRHGVRNEGEEDRIHLVFDVEASQILGDNGDLRTEMVWGAESNELTLENDPTPAIKSGSDLEKSFNLLIRELRLCDDTPMVNSWVRLIHDHLNRWNRIEKEFGINLPAVAHYQKAINTTIQEADELGDSLRFRVNKAKVISVFRARVAGAMNLQMLFNYGK